MTPTTFYCRLADWRWSWIGLQSLRPAETSKFSFLKSLLMTGVFTLIWMTLVILFIAATQPGPGSMPSGYYYGRSLGAVLAVIGTACIFGHWQFTRLFWNQRAKKLTTNDLSSATKPYSSRWLMWLFCFIYIPIFSFATPLAALISLENAWGSYRWHQVRTRLESEGEKLDFSDWKKNNGPTEKNINGLPVFIEAREDQKGDLRQLLNIPERHLPRRNSKHRTPLSMGEWAIAYQTAISNQVNNSNSPRTGKSDLPLYPGVEGDADPTTIVLKGLSVANELMDEICEASHLPFLRNFSDEDVVDLTFHFSELNIYKSIANFLKLRVQANLTSGNPQAAMADLQCAMRLANGMERKLFIEYLVNQSLYFINAFMVWDGLQQHGWKEDQLHWIQKEFEKIEFHEALLGALAFERTWGIAFMNEWSKPPVKGSQNENHSLGQRTWPRYVIRGWARLNQVALALTFEEWIEPARSWNPDKNAVTGLELLKQMDIKPLQEKHSYNIHYTMAKLTLPAYEKAFEKSLKAKHAMNSITTACALERYYLANQAYPKTLDDLVPEFLIEIPRDIMDQSIMKYEQTETGFFKLWSIGDDGEDNGGEPKDDKDWGWPME